MPRPANKFLALALRCALGFALAALALTALVLATAAFFRPDLSHRPDMPSAAAAAAAQHDRAAALSPENPPILWRNVDYALGPRAPWWPRGESPILAALVREKKLPPVAERTGPEPVVLEGVDGIGRYGGSLHRLATHPQDLDGILNNRLSYSTLARWSPHGYPIVPHLAKSWSPSPDLRDWTVTLRPGLRWSDGHPFTADDILFWYEQDVKLFQTEGGQITDFAILRHLGKIGTVEKVDDLTVRFRYADPNGLFPERLASQFDFARPAHYLRQFHPKLGDPAVLAATMRAFNLPSAEAVYWRMQARLNPEHPRLWPWVYRDYRASAPQSLVRNPYYPVVDAAGNQLPYLDRLVIDVKNKNVLPAAVAGGEVSFQDRHVDFEDYTLLATQAPRHGWHLLHWYTATRTMAQLSPNLNRAIDPARPETAWKHRLLNEKTFRQALSLAINRAEIIAAVWNGVGEPAQNSPGPASPYHHEKQFHAFTAFDPARAATMLDALGLARRDREGYRTFPDGTRMTWLLNVPGTWPPDAAELVADHWSRAGVRTLVQIRQRQLWQVEAMSLEHDFTYWPGLEEFMPVLDPRYFVPVNSGAWFALGYGRWYQHGGLHGDPAARGLPAPPPGSAVRRGMELYERVLTAPTDADRHTAMAAILDLAADELPCISIATAPPMLVAVKDGLRNVPRTALAGYFFQTPGNAGQDTYFWETPDDSPAITAQITHAIEHGSRLPQLENPAAAGEQNPAAPTPAFSFSSPKFSAFLWLAAATAFGLLALRHPFVWRRLLTLVPMLLAVSVIVFVIVQLPPGDFATAKQAELAQNGDPNAEAQLAELRTTFHQDEPAWKQYAHWMGLKWFATFDTRDTGLLQGNLGRSMESRLSVNEIVGDRLALTFVISLLTIMFTWAVALPIGIYSAARPYTVGDYALTLLGFAGMSVPPFLLALVLMWASGEFFGVSVSGLFSVRYASDPAWSWGKFVDLLQHVWVTVLVLGAGSTAVMIRVMRANLLDELKKPYVVAARAKGVRPLRLLLKYPVRIALNPFVSGLAGLFPQLISGGAIVALVLSLPTVGPLLLTALLQEDTYFAASMLMVLSVLGAIGTLVSDLLLLWLDPRIRLEGGAK